MDRKPMVRRLNPGDAEALVILRMEALETDPLAFAASPEDDRGLSIDFVRDVLDEEEGQAVFGAFDGGRLVGMVGVYREAKLKRRQIAPVWGVYVSPAARGKGLGRAMMEAVIEQARGWEGVEMVQLGAAVSPPAAMRLYELVGFRTWGVEKRALKWEGNYGDEAHMVLEL
jgi:GNAT superfamily N-acetyltransferase